MNIIINDKVFNVVKFPYYLKSSKDSAILIKKRNYYSSFWKYNIDCLVIDDRNVVLLRYQNMPWGKLIKVDNKKEKTSILVLPKNASKNIKIGEVLCFKSEHVV